MPGNFKKEDLRVLKTRQALVDALVSLLYRRKFRKITVFDICEAALVSRAAFYSHFADKYALLRWWLLARRGEWAVRFAEDSALAGKELIGYLAESKRLIFNLTAEMDEELLWLLFETFSIAEPGRAQDGGDALSVFYGGGMIATLIWLGRCKTPPGDEAAGLIRALFESFQRERGNI